jgi:hypothetical protein
MLSMTKRLLARGVAEGKLAADTDPLRLNVVIAALSQFPSGQRPHSIGYVQKRSCRC